MSLAETDLQAIEARCNAASDTAKKAAYVHGYGFNFHASGDGPPTPDTAYACIAMRETPRLLAALREARAQWDEAEERYIKVRDLRDDEIRKRTKAETERDELRAEVERLKEQRDNDIDSSVTALVEHSKALAEAKQEVDRLKGEIAALLVHHQLMTEDRDSATDRLAEAKALLCRCKEMHIGRPLAREVVAWLEANK